MDSTSVDLERKVDEPNEKPANPLLSIAYYTQMILGLQSADVVDRTKYPLLQYTGDIMLALPSVASPDIGNFLQEYGKKVNNKTIKLIGRYFPEGFYSLNALYIILGEIGYDIFPDWPHKNVPGIEDIPAPLIFLLTSYFFSRRFKKQIA